MPTIASQDSLVSIRDQVQGTASEDACEGGNMAVRIRKSSWLALLPLLAAAGCCCQIIVPVPGGECDPGCEFQALAPDSCRDGGQRDVTAAMPCVDRRPSAGAVAQTPPPREMYPGVAPATEQPSRSNAFRRNSRGIERQIADRGPEFVATQTGPAMPTLTLAGAKSRGPFVPPGKAEAPPTLALAPPANAPANLTRASQAAAATAPHLNQPNLLPLIENAQPILRQEKFAKWQPPQYIPNAIAATALLPVDEAPPKIETRPANPTPPTAHHHEEAPSMSQRIQQHLTHNLEL
jgi:hypothetical protein